VLLKFEFINEEYSGRALSHIVINILESFNIRDRVLALIINNISNNLTLLDSFNESLAKSIDDIFVKDIIRFFLSCVCHSTICKNFNKNNQCRSASRNNRY